MMVLSRVRYDWRGSSSEYSVPLGDACGVFFSSEPDLAFSASISSCFCLAWCSTLSASDWKSSSSFAHVVR